MLLVMTKVELVGPKRDLAAVLGYIHHLGLLHIEDLTERLQYDLNVRRMQLDDDQLKLKETMEGQLVKVNGFLTALGTPHDQRGQEAPVDDIRDLKDRELIERTENLIDLLEESMKSLAEQKRNLQIELANLGKYETMLYKLRPLAKDFVALEGFETIMLLVDQKDIELVNLIQSRLTEITKEQFQIIAAELDADTWGIAILFSRHYAKTVREYLWSQHVNEVRLPASLARLPFKDTIKKLKERREELPKELLRVNNNLALLAAEHRQALVEIAEVLADRLAELLIVGSFGATEHAFVIQAWLPQKQLKPVESEISNRFKTRVMIEELELSEEERSHAPIVYSNPIGIRSFEPLIKMFGTPRYGSIDPTPFVAFFFPLFFGLILGDSGYALVIIALAVFLRYKYKANEVVACSSTIFILAGISSFVFGLIYGEFFGDLPERLHLIRPIHFRGLELPFNRAADEALVTTLILTVAIGGAHILLGLVLGIINALRAGSRHHVVEKSGLLLVLVGLLLIVIEAAGQLPLPLRAPGTALVVAAVPLLVYGGGVMGLLEVLGVIGNILSYARIMALGLVSVVLASLANKAGAGMGDNIVLAVLIAALIHTVNIAIHLFTPSIHALRLNFVEFFGRFFETGGREYKPFHKGGS